jgi:hypothetical protein
MPIFYFSFKAKKMISKNNKIILMKLQKVYHKSILLTIQKFKLLVFYKT